MKTALRHATFALLAFVLAAPEMAQAQGRGADRVFHSIHAANLPTATTIRRGDLIFEISHRFNSAISDGADALWGFDGPVFNRIGLAYGVADRVTLGVLRTNLEDNLELNAKVRLWEGGDVTRLALGAKGGVAWNTQLNEVEGAGDNESQAYVQLMANALLGERVALGVVPTYLRNPRVRDFGADDAFSLGLHGQLYLADGVSVLGEWIVSEEREDLEHDSGTFGLELETRGHFFKVLVTNQVRMNPTQFLGGASIPLSTNTLRVAFNITRLIPLG